MTQIGGNKEEDEDKNRVYNRKNTDLDSRLQIWLLFGPELVEKQTNVIAYLQEPQVVSTWRMERFLIC